MNERWQLIKESGLDYDGLPSDDQLAVDNLISIVAASERKECIAELVEAAENLAKTFNQFSHGRSKEEDDLLAALAKIKE